MASAGPPDRAHFLSCLNSQKPGLTIINPGFSSDCLETLEEIAGEAHEIFEEHGGEHFSHIPCLNDSDEGMAVIQAVVDRELKGWV